jgi:hypothetical protein
MEETMRHDCAIGILLAALTFAGPAQLSAQNAAPGDWQRVLDGDGVTVYDVVNKVVWLADANLAAKVLPNEMPPDNNFRFGLPLCHSPDQVPCVKTGGSMNSDSATAWVAAMNAYDGGNGYADLRTDA